MKRVLLQVAMWLCMGCWLTAVHAQPRSMDELDSIANSVLRLSGARSFVAPLKMTYSASQVLKATVPLEHEAFYVYTPIVDDIRNFVIVSGDRRMPAVLGYSSGNRFDLEKMPDGLRWYLQMCQEAADRLSLRDEVPTMTTTRATTAVAPLLGDITWNQGEPFNNQCPESNAWVRTATGCTATAMAQVMAYHKHPQKGTGKVYYTTPSFGYVVNADLDNAPAYDWANMIGSYRNPQAYTQAQADAVAQLMFHAGAVVNTDYGEDNSAAPTSSPEGALLNHFHYDDGMRILRVMDYRNDYYLRVLNDELYAGRPMIVSGFDSNHSMGHAFVFDGLDNQGFYHVNWGWGGLCDGYYSFYNLIPEDTGIGGGVGDFSYYVQALIGIRPDDGVAETDPTNMVASLTESVNGLGTFDLSKPLSLSAIGVQNMRYLTFHGRLQLMLTNADGTETVAMLGSSVPVSGLPQDYMLNDPVTLSGKLPDGIANGKYRLYIGAKQNGYDEWGQVKTKILDVTERYDYYNLTVSGGKYALESSVSGGDEGGGDEGDVKDDPAPIVVSQITNSKAYTIHCERGTLGIQNGRLVATSREDITLEAQQFLLYRYNGKFYLYNLEKQAFVGLDDNTDNSDRYAWTGVLPSKACISLEHSDNDAFPFIIKFGNLWLNVYEGYDPGLVINAYTSKDGGNQFRLAPVEKVSEEVQESIQERLEAAMATEPRVILPWGSDTPWECTYRFSESYDNYTEPANDAAGRGWKELDYDDSSWPTMTGPIASSSNTPLPSYNHTWEGDYNCYDLRRKFTMEHAIPELAKVYFRTLFDDEIRVFLNGNLLIEDTQYTGSIVRQYEIPADAFIVGENILSIRIAEVVVESYFDYSIDYEQLPNPYTDAQGVKYQLSAEDNTATIIGHAASVSKDLTIPLSIEGFKVTGIAAGAFADVDDLTSVTMLLEKPYALPADAFSSAVYQHARLIVPYGHESVYQNTTGWSQFNQVTYYAPDEYTDEQGVIYALNEDGETYMVKGYTENLVSKVVIPETLHGKAVTVIYGHWGHGAFTGSSQLEEIVISNSIIHIGEGAFDDCPNLKRVHIGSGVKTIVSGAAYGGMYQVGYNPCQHCPSLETITVDENNKYFSSYNGMMYDKAQTILCIVPGSVKELDEDDYPKTITTFGMKAFSGDAVKEIVVPASVALLDYGCMMNCSQLEKLTIKSHALDIHCLALEFTPMLKDVYMSGYYPMHISTSAGFGQESDFMAGVNTQCVIHVPHGLADAYRERLAEVGRSFSVVDDMELPDAIDVDYSLGYEHKSYGSGFGGPKIGAGFLMKKEEIKAYAGCRITSVQAHIQCWENSDLYVSVSKGVGGEQLAYASTVPGEFDDWRKISFLEPYTITGEEEELFVGIGTTGSGGMRYTEINTLPDDRTLWMNWGGLAGDDWRPSTEGVALAYTIEGDNLPANIRMTETTLTADEQGSYRIKGKLESCTIGLVDGCDIAYSIDGGEPVTTHFDLQMVAKRHYEFEIPLAAEVGAGKHQVDVWVTKVGDRPDGIGSDSRAQFTLVGQNERYARKVVVEEGTGTWCGYCPRGIVGMRTMLQNYPDNFIPIAVHDGDNMYSSSYGELNGRFSGFPSCTMNRKYDFDPNAADLEKFYQQEVNQAVARIGMEAQWADEGMTKVLIKTTSRFAFDMTEEYRIAYAVTESQVGPYMQVNYYAGGEEMGGFEKEPGAVSILHDHVARSISTLNGEPGSVPAQPKGMTDYAYTYTLTLPDNIDNKQNIGLVVLLINQQTGEIANADHVSFSGIAAYDPAAAIDATIVDQQGDDTYYDLQGRPLNGRPTQQGVYIRQGEKVVVK